MMLRQIRRSAVMYITLLASSTLVAVIGLSALSAVRIERRAAEDGYDAVQARLNARAGVELAILWVDNNPNWRTTYTNGAWSADLNFGGSKTVGVEGYDLSDADLSDSPSDPLVLVGVGKSGNAVHKTAVTLNPLFPPISALTSALHADGGIVILGTATVNSDHVVSSNGNVTAVLATVNADVSAAGGIFGITYNGSNQIGITALEMPPSDAFDYYTTNGTEIPVTSLPFSGGGYRIENVAIGPASNPYGAANAMGIYYMNCKGARLTITNARIISTLVILNAASGLTVEGSVSWTTPNNTLPALMTDVDLTLNMSSAALANAGTLDLGMAGVSIGDPMFEDGATLESAIRGLVYTTGMASIGNDTTINGVMIVGLTATLDGLSTFNFDRSFYDDPPPGFTSTPVMEVVPGSWRRWVE